MDYNAESNWILERHTATPGRGSVTCHRWRWRSVDTGEVLETTTDSTMRNWHTQGWDNLSQDPAPWGVYTNIHRSSQRSTNQGRRVASADYRPIMQHRLTQAEAEWMVNEIGRPSSTFDDLFEVDA